MAHFSSLEIIENTLYHWGMSFLVYLPNVLLALIILWICYFLTHYLHGLSNHVYKRFFNGMEGMQRMTNTIINILFWVLAIILVLDILNLSSFVTHVLAGAGIIGIVAGFALKDIASNAFAGFLIRVNRPYSIGDWVEINSYIGVVEQQGLITTGIRTIQGQMAYIPNELIFSNAFVNYTTFGKYRVIVEFGVSYGDDLDYVEKLAIETVKKLPMVISPEEIDLYFMNVGSSTYNFVVRFWVKYNERRDYLKANSAAIKALKRTFDEAGICVAYNVMTLDFGVKGGVNLYDQPISVQMMDSSQSKKP